MSQTDLECTFTQHAMLVAWGPFAQAIGFIRVWLHKTCVTTQVFAFSDHKDTKAPSS